MSLFDDGSRTYDGYASHAESHFEYLNRSARPEAEAIRTLLNKWFDDFPGIAQADVRARFRKADPGSYYGAFTELYCHAYCRGLGFEANCHPHIEGKRQPDFSLTKDQKLFAYVECTVATEFREGNTKQERMNRIYDVLNQNIDSPDFFIAVDILQFPERSMSAERIRRFLEGKLQGLDPDVVGTELQRSGSIHDSPYYWVYEDDGFSVAFYPIPKSDEARGKSGLRPLGAFSSGGPFAHVVDDRTPILNALEAKAKRYGHLNQPYIIALNAIEDGLDNFDISGALFGQEQLSITRGTGERSSGRAPDGFWQGPRGPRNRLVSGVLMMIHVDPWNIATRVPVLWHNPWATHPIPPEAWTAAQQIPNPVTSKTEFKDGMPPYQILGIDNAWPRSDMAQ